MGVEQLRERLAKYAEYRIEVKQLEALSPGDRKALQKVVEASRLLNGLFLKQSYEHSEEIRRVSSSHSHWPTRHLTSVDSGW